MSRNASRLKLNTLIPCPISLDLTYLSFSNDLKETGSEYSEYLESSGSLTVLTTETSLIVTSPSISEAEITTDANKPPCSTFCSKLNEV